MRDRIFNFREYWNRIVKDHKPELSFRFSGLEFDEWSISARKKLMELLGPFPEKVPLNAEIEYSVDQGEYIRQRVVFDVDKYMSLPCVVLIPKGAKNGEKFPATSPAEDN